VIFSFNLLIEEEIKKNNHLSQIYLCKLIEPN